MPTSKSSRILHRLIALGPATRGELGDELDVSSATVTRLVRPLMRRGVIEVLDVDGSDSSLGKPAYRLAIVPSCACFIGIKITDSRSFAVVSDMSGSVLGVDEILLSDDDVDQVLSRIIGQVERLSERRSVAGVGIGVGGRVSDGRVVSSGILGWNDVNVSALLGARLDIPVTVANDVDAFAQSESWWGEGRGCRSFVLVSIGSGIGACIVNDGVVYAGEHGAAGMVGHLPVSRGGPRCESGHAGCVRAYASSTCIMRRLREEYGIDETYADFVRRAAAGAEAEKDVADSAVEAVARVVSASIAFVDPDVVVVSGEGVGLLTAFESTFMSRIDSVRHWNAPQVDVVLRDTDFSSWALGGAAAAMESWASSFLS